MPQKFEVGDCKKCQPARTASALAGPRRGAWCSHSRAALRTVANSPPRAFRKSSWRSATRHAAVWPIRNSLFANLDTRRTRNIEMPCKALAGWHFFKFTLPIFPYLSLHGFLVGFSRIAGFTAGQKSVCNRNLVACLCGLFWPSPQFWLGLCASHVRSPPRSSSARSRPCAG